MIIPPLRNDLAVSPDGLLSFRHTKYLEEIARNINGIGALFTADNELIIGSDQFPVDKVVLGSNGETNTAPRSTLTATVTDASGTDVHATDFILRTGRSTGAAAGTSLKLQTSIPSGSGSALQAVQTMIELLEAKLAFFGGTPVAQPTGYTQTYATTTRTHNNLTSSTLSDSSGGTANTTVQALTDPADTPATADALRDDLVANLIPELRNNFADLTAQVNNLRTDITNLKDLFNQVIDDLQGYGLLA